MAYWNAPNDVENHADKALIASIEQLKVLDEINEINLKEKLPRISIRIGINSGEAFVGEVGGEIRSDYTVMGQTVNTAAILEQICKFYKANLIISEYTKKKLTQKYTMMLIDKIKVEGTVNEFDIYQVFTFKSNEFIEEDIKTFEKAVKLYRFKKLDEAILIFRNLKAKDDFVNRHVCDIYIKRCEKYMYNMSEFTSIQNINKALISGS